MKSSTNVKFIKSSRNVYATSDRRFELINVSNRYCVSANNNIVKWQPYFLSVTAAERFLDSHQADPQDEYITYSSDDIEFIIDYYGFRSQANGVWIAEVNGTTLILTISPQEFVLNVETEDGKTSSYSYRMIEDLLLELDSYYKEDQSVFSSTGIPINITAASNARDLARNLVRVKSSNIWAYGMNLEDRKQKEGTLVVQFKGPQGGPGDIYMYYDVPVVVWRKWLNAASKGNYFWKFIRNNFYYRKMTGDKRGKLKNALN